MSDLFRFDWRAFDPLAGTKVAIGFIIMLILMKVTDQTWVAIGVVALLVWLTNVPGRLKDRISGMVVFGLGAVVFTLLAGNLELSVVSNTIAIAVVGFIGSLALAGGIRAFMVGYMLIAWAIYAPLLVSSTSVMNCVLAVVAGTTVLVALNVIYDRISGAQVPDRQSETIETEFDMQYVLAYSATIALVLAVTTYLGWTYLSVDPTLVTAGAFFIIGFDSRKTWVAGIARVTGIVVGTIIGIVLFKIIGSGLVLDTIIVTACFMCFATMAVHPACFMFFFMILLAATWHGLELEKLNLTFWERMAGETTGVIVAMLAITALQYFQQAMSRRT